LNIHLLSDLAEVILITVQMGRHISDVVMRRHVQKTTYMAHNHTLIMWCFTA